MTAAKRMRALRERKRKAGLVPVEVWTFPHFAAKVREWVAKLNGRKE